MASIASAVAYAAHLALEAVKLPYRFGYWLCGRVVSIVSDVCNYLTGAKRNDVSVFSRASISDRNVSVYVGSSCYGSIKGAGEPVMNTRDVGSFQAVSISGIGDIYLHKGPVRPIEITTEPNIHDYLDTRVEHGKLMVGVKPGYSISTDKGVTIHAWSPSYDAAEGSGLTKIKVVDGIVQDTFRINVSGSGAFEGDVNVRDLRTDISSLAKAKLTGGALNHTAHVSGSGVLEASGLNTSQCDVDISSLGSANINCDRNLDSTVSGSGKLHGNLAVERLQSSVSSLGKATFTGHATTHNMKISGSGFVNAGELRTADSTAEISSLGKAEIFCEHRLKASVSSSGSLKYKGQPKVEANISSLGKVEPFGPVSVLGG
ncbi:head GIN domain-containing protein [Endozoicomonas elysicola]|uniref:Putative auto-transporter adhesin head GIN domain-containing protein n=1 Tax=Endozoicomonas elysicola TaxID=305900 RepID=A0A081K6T7_9GAMM|nr:head GIN domain-containing protein [Endozoicomonas elysicola]KEI69863.1 hypothetical protein GV64_03095 [Endozoicomonas elysicola]